MANIEKHTESLTVNKIYEQRESTQESSFRFHLGASLIGEPCQRKLWYIFRWAAEQKHSGRLLRLFERGQNEEDVFNQELRNIGVDVLEYDPHTGKQWRISDCGGHFGGSLDGIAKSGVPESPNKPHVLEYKTHGDKSFAELKKKGVYSSKPLHFAQMQIYMHYKQIDRALYLAVNKNTDELYSERVKYDKDEAQLHIDKAWNVVLSKEPPIRLYDSPVAFGCKFCDYKNICHGEELPEVNCRTCAHSTPNDESGKWDCAKWGAEIPGNAQQAGCDEHLYIPVLVTYGEPVDADAEANTVTYKMKEDDRQFTNCKDKNIGYSSKELKNISKELIGDSVVDTFRTEFDAEVTGSDNNANT